MSLSCNERKSSCVCVFFFAGTMKLKWLLFNFQCAMKENAVRSYLHTSLHNLLAKLFGDGAKREKSTSDTETE